MTPDFHAILVPIDFSAASKNALAYAATLAERFGVPLRVVHVLEEPINAVPLPIEYAHLTIRETLLANARGQLAEALSSISPARAEAHAEVLFGNPVGAILADAANHHVDLIVMGTQGRTGVTRVILGSVAEQIVRRARCPVMVVHGEHHRPTEITARTEDPVHA